MGEVYLSLGSNQGNRQANLQAALKKLEVLLGKPVKVSGIYRTAAWGKTDQPGFLNQVLSFHMEPGQETWLLQRILETEMALGRVRKEKWEARAIDIDILLAGEKVINTETLTVPHPWLHLRRFVLVPLNEIAPDLLHPVLDKTIRELLEICPDRLEAEKIADS
ncbi:2-amino-4-hydroxy-6-hydroxymethyldihydropteridine diphosphokinase [Anseongella ginsenosidimutans]|uniref:2-amino-4-hydroxy-6-hydroxymethyldihydropteridine pyrophosphokinase n=1 Tax=Anseongella ginsenosidimutans TaxID=496056 RepID=A0A4R3KNG9_9SPHI|nr:2-amino-4-hydroxy-6-hydroxymethyldihydropteridine diphosphokinase [Anseongella ginsenosidimutans]QEC53706.1 2-amino-4-hydroxy-6-hydroxymethyldihydropteridine diphosphokinase [Anseongella ginsenosidimutans]TCS86043.1 2-amino-4-hydroxy-6-hydroxymethyldihydropteridine diphosphokinase [Anseongella ginsenosidimutans]